MRSDQRTEPYPLETFDVKVTCIDTTDRLDVRLLVKRSEHRETRVRVLMVKKNEIKNVTFDILNLHRYTQCIIIAVVVHYVLIICRQYDMRIGLHHYQCVQDGEPLYGVVREMLGRISFPSRHIVRIQPKTSRWNVHLIRHKKTLTYLVDDKFAINIADVSEHSFDVKTGESAEFDMRMETKAVHAEVEVRFSNSEPAFLCDCFGLGTCHIAGGSVTSIMIS